MVTYIILSRFSPEAFDDPQGLQGSSQRGIGKDQEAILACIIHEVSSEKSEDALRG